MNFLSLARVAEQSYIRDLSSVTGVFLHNKVCLSLYFHLSCAVGSSHSSIAGHEQICPHPTSGTLLPFTSRLCWRPSAVMCSVYRNLGSPPENSEETVALCPPALVEALARVKSCYLSLRVRPTGSYFHKFPSHFLTHMRTLPFPAHCKI